MALPGTALEWWLACRGHLRCMPQRPMLPRRSWPRMLLPGGTAGSPWGQPRRHLQYGCLDPAGRPVQPQPDPVRKHHLRPCEASTAAGSGRLAQRQRDRASTKQWSGWSSCGSRPRRLSEQQGLRRRRRHPRRPSGEGRPKPRSAWLVRPRWTPNATISCFLRFVAVGWRACTVVDS